MSVYDNADFVSVRDLGSALHEDLASGVALVSCPVVWIGTGKKS